MATVAAASQDLVTMFHALEHVPDPRAVLTTVRGWIRRGGHLVVEVPNIAARVQAPSHQYHYAHLYHFTGSTLGALGEAAGLRLIDLRYTEDRGNVDCACLSVATMSRGLRLGLKPRPRARWMR